MAQIKKTEIENKILLEARKEFLKSGFNGASLRKIAFKSKVSVANLYNYYPNKDALFNAVVSRLKKDLVNLSVQFEKYQPESKNLDAIDVEIERAKIAAHYIFENKLDFHLLFNRSHGSSLENFGEKLIQSYATNCKTFLSFLKKNNHISLTIPTDHFFASVGRMFLEATKQAASSKINLEIIEKQALELTYYNHFGFQGVSTLKKGKKL